MRLMSTVCLSALSLMTIACAQMPAGSYTTGNAANAAPDAPSAIPERVAGNEWYQTGRDTLQANLAKKPIVGRAKNVILFVADGMDPTTVTAARILAGQEKGMSGEENVLSFETLPNLALSKTYNTDAQVPDSAGTATAMMTGVKTKAGVISVDDSVIAGDCDSANPVLSTGELAAQAGMAVGVVSTARLTHATPATVYAHSPDRNWESDTDVPPEATACADIASQLLDFPYGDGIDVALGGGRRNFLPSDAVDPEYEDDMGSREDGRNLIAEWQDAGGAYVWDRAGFESATATPLLGLFEPSHMQYEADRADDGAGEPSLAEMTAKAIDLLGTDENGYFLLVEGGRVDHAHHAGNAARALTDVRAFAAAVETAMEVTDMEETLIVVTADHGHTMTISGYPERGNPILGVAGSGGNARPAGDGKPYTTLTYANGPGSIFVGAREGNAIERPFVTMEEATDIDYQQQSLIPGYSETHGGQDVTIFAGGPSAYLFDGTVEQNYIFHVIDYALDLNVRAEAAGTE